MDAYAILFLVALVPMPCLAVLAWISTLGMRLVINARLEPERRVPMLWASAESRWEVEVFYAELHPDGVWGRFYFASQIAFLTWPLVSVVILVIGYISIRSSGL